MGETKSELALLRKIRPMFKEDYDRSRFHRHPSPTKMLREQRTTDQIMKSLHVPGLVADSTHIGNNIRIHSI